MDSQEVSQNGNVGFLILRWSLALLFPIVAFSSLSLLVVLVAVFVANSSVTSPISVSSQCRIVSSSKLLLCCRWILNLGLFGLLECHCLVELKMACFALLGLIFMSFTKISKAKPIKITHLYATLLSHNTSFACNLSLIVHLCSSSIPR